MGVPRGSNMLASVVCKDIMALGEAVAWACRRCENGIILNTELKGT